MINISEYLLGKNKKQDIDPKETWSMRDIANWAEGFGVKEVILHVDKQLPENEIYYMCGDGKKDNEFYVLIGLMHIEDVYDKKQNKLYKNQPVHYGVTLRPKPNDPDYCDVKGTFFDDWLNFDDAVIIAKEIMLAGDNDKIIDILNNYKKYLNNK